MNDEFESWWALYPRKEGKLPAKKLWARMLPSERFAALKALPRHLENWRIKGTETYFVPMPKTWLSQQRWDDELVLEIPEKVATAWWATSEGLQSKGREMGISPKPGEDWPAFKRRVIDAVKKAA
jgi:hypothetical protein